jgi:hypothetical protein
MRTARASLEGRTRWVAVDLRATGGASGKSFVRHGFTSFSGGKRWQVAWSLQEIDFICDAVVDATRLPFDYLARMTKQV